VTTKPVHFSVTFDATDPVALSGWWADTLGWERRWHGDDMAIIHPPDAEEGSDEHMLFFRVPEKKTVKNRCHLDLHPEGDAEAYVDELLARGASLQSRQGDGWPVRWVVLNDPEGNELCVLLGPNPDWSPPAG
jgi:hypothetical protein